MTKDWRQYKGVLLLLALLFSCGERTDKKEANKVDTKNPNIIIIAVDDLRPELGVYGNEIIKTPNIDKLAAEGSLFNKHYVQVPTCGASRYALMTGLRPSFTQHLKNDIFYKEMAGKPEPTDPESFVDNFRRNGYYTVGIGKLSHSVDGGVYGYEEEPSDVKEMPYSWDEFHFNSGKWGTGWNSFFAYENGENRQSMDRQVKPYEAGLVGDDGYPDGLTANLALEELRKLNEKKQPFFLGVGFFKPHLPFNAPKKYWDLYDREEIPLPPFTAIPENVNKKSLQESGEFNGYQLTDEKAGLDKVFSEAYTKKVIHAYYASVSYVDAQIGKLLDEVKSLGLEEDTVIVLWGDHGWHLGNDRVWGKHTLSEWALRSALIVKVPGIQNKEINTTVETVDIYPTLLDVAGIKSTNNVDGTSFLPLLSNQGNNQKQVAYSYYKNGISVRTDRYRLTKYFREELPVVELYDYEVDPYETKNTASENPDLTTELMTILEKGNTGLYNKP